MKHLLILLMLWPAHVMAHSKASTTSPADGAVLTAAPDNIAFTFDKGIRLVSVKVDGNDVDLSGLSGFAMQIDLPAPDLPNGRHDVTWRGLSDDGHPVSGRFFFTVQ